MADAIREPACERARQQDHDGEGREEEPFGATPLALRVEGGEAGDARRSRTSTRNSVSETTTTRHSTRTRMRNGSRVKRGGRLDSSGRCQAMAAMTRFKSAGDRAEPCPSRAGRSRSPTLGRHGHRQHGGHAPVADALGPPALGDEVRHVGGRGGRAGPTRRRRARTPGRAGGGSRARSRRRPRRRHRARLQTISMRRRPNAVAQGAREGRGERRGVGQEAQEQAGRERCSPRGPGCGTAPWAGAGRRRGTP